MLDNLRESIHQYKLKQKLLANNAKLKIGKNSDLRHPEYVHCSGVVTLGDNCKLYCWDSYQSNVFDYKPQILMGGGVRATKNLTIQCARSITLKNDVLLASNVFITDYNHGMSPVANSYLDNPLDISDGVIIDSGAWIGNNVIILGGVSIGEKAVIGAGAVVTKSIPAYSIAVGNPARVIKQYDHKRGEWVSCV